MKIKSDFVTNSSSCSFIVSGTSTKRLAKKIVDIIFKETEEYFTEYSKDEEFKKKIYKTIKELNSNENILIPFSCNYETFISKTKDEKSICVDTCTNHCWDDLKIIDYLGPDCSDDDGKRYDEEMDYQGTLEFINIQNGKKGSKHELIEACTNEIAEMYKVAEIEVDKNENKE